MNKKELNDFLEKAIDEMIEAKEEQREEVKEGERLTAPLLKTLLEKVLNRAMLSERGVYLKSLKEDVANGYYQRTLSTGMGKLELEVPRTRRSYFRSIFLPEHYNRAEESYNSLLSALIHEGYSSSKLKRILTSMGITYSPEGVEKIIEEIKTEYYDFVSRELPSETFAIYIDGYKSKLKNKDTGKVENIIIYTVIGVDFDWKKDLYGFYIFSGNENKQGWLRVFNDLIMRGMKKVDLIVSDDFSGIKDTISELFPLSDHQLCITHLKRNVTKHMSREDAIEFNNEFSNIKNSKSYDIAERRFSKLLMKYKEKYGSFIAYLWKRKENYINFTKYPDRVRKYIYTTNVSENFNRRIEEIRIRLSGYFQGEEVLGINIILQLKKLKTGKWRKPQPILKANEYELLQMHKLKFKDMDEELNVSEVLKEMELYNNSFNKHNERSIG